MTALTCPLPQIWSRNYSKASVVQSVLTEVMRYILQKHKQQKNNNQQFKQLHEIDPVGSHNATPRKGHMCIKNVVKEIENVNFVFL